jgi:DNA repair protein RadC
MAAIKKPSAAQLAARAKFTEMVKAKAAAKKTAKKVAVKKVVAKKVAAKKVNGWYKGTTAFIEKNESKKDNKKNVRVYRNPKGGLFKPGTFNNFNALSGYSTQKEIIVGKIGNATLLKSLAPEVKLRILRGKKVNSNKVTNGKDSVDILRKFIPASKVQTQEFAVALYLNNNNNVLAAYQFGMGGFTATVMEFRLLMAAALKLGATSIILCHNHPSGNLKPSDADKVVTKQIINVANLHNISILDHIILTKDGYYSFAENGILR